MSIFKTGGFDTLIGKGCSVSGAMSLVGSCVIDGSFNGDSVKSDPDAKGKTTLLVNGTCVVDTVLIANDLTITGTVKAKSVTVEGVLAVKSGATLDADVVYYRSLVIESGAIILAHMKHLDHGREQV